MEWILRDVSYLKYFARGLIETDGGYYTHLSGNKYHVQMSFTAKHLWAQRAFKQVIARFGFYFTEPSPGNYYLSGNHAKEFRRVTKIVKNKIYSSRTHRRSK